MSDESKLAKKTTQAGSGRKPSAWLTLQGRLAENLGALEDGHYLILSALRDEVYVQFAAQGALGIRAESISNRYLPKGRKLGRSQTSALRALGWEPPEAPAREGEPKRPSSAGPNFYRDFESPVPCDEVAELAVRTLVEVFGVTHPRFVSYYAFERDRGDILLPTLGLKRRQSVLPPEEAPAETPDEIRALLLGEVRLAFGVPGLEYDTEGDLTLRCGSAVVFVRVLDEAGPCIRMFSPLVTNIEKTALPLELLNDLNSDGTYVRFFVQEQTIFAAIDLPAAPFVARHATDALSMLGLLADDLDGNLRKRFGGKTGLKA